MESYIESIILLNEENDKKYVDFKEGINIITGESKTGKSALVEIIDYCLCSSRCTIPKGKITDFATLFSLIIVIKSNRYIIARKSIFIERKKMYFSHIADSVTHESINKFFFDEEIFCDFKTVQKQIEKVLGLNVTNFKEDADETKEKASLRHMTSYMFQHQNLMASKFALFYRFDDYQKKKDVIQQFPIFAGMVGQEYYSTLMLLSGYKKELKKNLANKISNEKIKEDMRSNLLSKFKDYYALIGQALNNDLTLEQLIQLANELPTINDDTYASDQIVIRYNQLKQEVEELNDKKVILESRISKLGLAEKNSKGYISSLEILHQKSDLSMDNVNNYICPLCNGECNDINKISKKVQEATSWISNEMSLIGLSTNHFSEEKRKLIEQKEEITKEIKKLWAKIKTIEREYLSNNNTFGLENKLTYSKIEIRIYIETINKGLFYSIDEEIIEIQEKIDSCNKILGEFNLEMLKESAKRSIDNNMNRLKEQLDFEEEFKKYKLSFNLDQFELALFGKYEGEKVTLSEMGSGANWVSCHIALFLSLLRYFAAQGNISPMPLIMFFDQPSQVYFPQVSSIDNKKASIESEKDKHAVTKMYKVMFDEIEEIYKDTGIKPQLIVVDHVNSATMQGEIEKANFVKYTRRVWRGNEALI
ncbi:hypothetical protein A7L45_07740 [Clostridium estertheticum subsp. estertheticum]|uniref:DUF3732 domain-containing protein n=2 Tax=Clostridium estertheticum TaxID=238834 RepID=A0A1J0GFA6_9CLOT|nr:hypothetical protein A7L45_07740 [Clostridium estertheticum subsp. estertheticum]